MLLEVLLYWVKPGTCVTKIPLYLIWLLWVRLNMTYDNFNWMITITDEIYLLLIFSKLDFKMWSQRAVDNITQ